MIELIATVIMGFFIAILIIALIAIIAVIIGDTVFADMFDSIVIVMFVDFIITALFILLGTSFL